MRTFKQCHLACSLMFAFLAVVMAPFAAADSASTTPLWLVTIEPATTNLRHLSRWTAEQQGLAQAHGRYLETLYKKGAIVYGGRAFDVTEGGRLTDESFALVVVRSTDRAAVVELLAKDPAVRGGLLAAKVISFDQAFPGPGR